MDRKGGNGRKEGKGKERRLWEKNMTGRLGKGMSGQGNGNGRKEEKGKERRLREEI